MTQKIEVPTIKYDLENRTTKFAIELIKEAKIIPENLITRTIIVQLIRSAGSIGANYREANDSLGKKDFLHRLRISRKEAKEAIHWLELLNHALPQKSYKIEQLTSEAIELKKILSAIIIKTEKNPKFES